MIYGLVLMDEWDRLLLVGIDRFWELGVLGLGLIEEVGLYRGRLMEGGYEGRRV